MLGRKRYLLRVKCPEDDSWKDFKEYDHPYKYRELKEEDPEVEELAEMGCSLAFYEVDSTGKKKQLWHRAGKVGKQTAIELRSYRLAEMTLKNILPTLNTTISSIVQAVSKQYEIALETQAKQYERIIDSYEKQLEKFEKKLEKLEEKLQRGGEERMSPTEYLAEILYVLNEAEKIAEMVKQIKGGGGEESFWEMLFKILFGRPPIPIPMMAPQQLQPQLQPQQKTPPTPVEAAIAPMMPTMQLQRQPKLEVPEEYKKLAEEILGEVRAKTAEQLAPCRALGECEEGENQ